MKENLKAVEVQEDVSEDDLRLKVLDIEQQLKDVKEKNLSFDKKLILVNKKLLAVNERNFLAMEERHGVLSEMLGNLISKFTVLTEVANFIQSTVHCSDTRFSLLTKLISMIDDKNVEWDDNKTLKQWIEILESK
jgi:hypothetical protein